MSHCTSSHATNSLTLYINRTLRHSASLAKIDRTKCTILATRALSKRETNRTKSSSSFETPFLASSSRFRQIAGLRFFYFSSNRQRRQPAQGEKGLREIFRPYRFWVVRFRDYWFLVRRHSSVLLHQKLRN